MTHPIMFAKDYLDFDEAEAEAEIQSALPFFDDYYNAANQKTLQANLDALEVLSFSATVAPSLLAATLEQFKQLSPGRWEALLGQITGYVFQEVKGDL